MYSKIKIAGHPIHLMLVSFPIVFYATACVAYISYAFASLDVFWFRLAYVANVAGVITALIAAVPGFIDWAMGIPTNSPAKLTGFYHLLFNLSALVLFSLCAGINSSQYSVMVPNATLGVWLSLFGLAFALCAVFLGWKMTGTYHIGINLTPEQERMERFPDELADIHPLPQKTRESKGA